MELNEKQKNKLLKTLGKWGVSPEEAAEFLTDYSTDDEKPEMEAEAPAEAEAEPSQPESDIDGAKPEPSPEAPAAPEATEEPQEEQPVPPAEEAEQTPEPPVPPTEAETPAEQEPLPDPRMDELEKALEGISSRLDAFIDSLTKAGILVEAPAKEQVGIESDKGFGNSPKDESLGDTLARLNRGKSY